MFINHRLLRPAGRCFATAGALLVCLTNEIFAIGASAIRNYSSQAIADVKNKEKDIEKTDIPDRILSGSGNHHSN